jgi:hypothetical protein
MTADDEEALNRAGRPAFNSWSGEDAMRDQAGARRSSDGVRQQAVAQASGTDASPASCGSRTWLGWLANAGCHGALLLVLLGVYWAVSKPVPVVQPTRMHAPGAAAPGAVLAASDHGGQTVAARSSVERDGSARAARP